ncbi:MAG: hypothetical protein JFR41_05965 [Muribaculaceae bacterium]|nr:hypothetical protein [Muribaculaceae bacterium]
MKKLVLIAASVFALFACAQDYRRVVPRSPRVEFSVENPIVTLDTSSPAIIHSPGRCTAVYSQRFVYLKDLSKQYNQSNAPLKCAVCASNDSAFSQHYDCWRNSLKKN